jgi:hypothetical protein
MVASMSVLKSLVKSSPDVSFSYSAAAAARRSRACATASVTEAAAARSLALLLAPAGAPLVNCFVSDIRKAFRCARCALAQNKTKGLASGMGCHGCGTMRKANSRRFFGPLPLVGQHDFSWSEGACGSVQVEEKDNIGRRSSALLFGRIQPLIALLRTGGRGTIAAIPHGPTTLFPAGQFPNYRISP